MPSHHLLHRHLHERRGGHSHATDFSHAFVGNNVQHRSSALSADAFINRQIVNVGSGIQSIQRRSEEDDSSDKDDSDRLINVLLTVLAIVFFALILASAFLIFRRSRMLRAINPDEKSVLPEYKETGRNPHNLTIETTHNGHSSVVVIGRDGRPMLKNSSAPPNSPDNVPEIRITFPDEQTLEGQSQKGRVLVVRVGDNASVGLEPVKEEQLPAYEKEAKGQFESIDMDTIGGLKDEKDRSYFK